MRGKNICATIAEGMIFRILVIVCVSKDVIDKVRRPDGSIGLTPLYTVLVLVLVKLSVDCGKIPAIHFINILSHKKVSCSRFVEALIFHVNQYNTMLNLK